MSFKNFFKTHLTEAEVEEQLSILNEARWWGKFKEDRVSILEYKDETGKKKKFKVCKMDEDGGPAYVIEARGGCRYGLYRAVEGKFHMARLKPGAKILKNPKGVFKEVDGKLVFELFHLAGKSQKLGGGPDAIRQAVQRKQKAFDPEATLMGGRPNLDVRPGQGMDKPAEKAFNPEATLREVESNEVITQNINAYLKTVMNFDPKKIRNWWARTDSSDVGLFYDEKVKPWISQAQSFGLEERRANIEPDKSFPNGEPTFDKNTDEWNKGVYTDAKA